MTDSEIREAMNYCYEERDGSCDQCPLYSECRQFDADTLGEIFMRLEDGEDGFFQGVGAFVEGVSDAQTGEAKS